MHDLRFGFSILYSTNTDNKSNEELLKQQLKEKYTEIDSLAKENERINNEKKIAEEKAKKELEEKNKISGELNAKIKTMQSDLDKANIDKEKTDKEIIEKNKTIDEENKKIESTCSCYVIMYASKNNVDDANKLIASLKSGGVNEVRLFVFNDAQLNKKYYRVISKCFTNPSDAYFEKQKITEIANKLNINPIIICNK
jgi:hypothetical protein